MRLNVNVELQPELIAYLDRYAAIVGTSIEAMRTDLRSENVREVWASYIEESKVISYLDKYLDLGVDWADFALHHLIYLRDQRKLLPPWRQQLVFLAHREMKPQLILGPDLSSIRLAAPNLPLTMKLDTFDMEILRTIKTQSLECVVATKHQDDWVISLMITPNAEVEVRRIVQCVHFGDFAQINIY